MTKPPWTTQMGLAEKMRWIGEPPTGQDAVHAQPGNSIASQAVSIFT